MKKWRGFTIIEVSLFLAITGLIFLGVAVGVSNSISQQRNNDAVQSFAEFSRKAYSDVVNVQNNESKGNTEKAIYGKLVTFGEKKNLSGGDNNNHEIFLYNVIGNIDDDVTGSNTLDLLKKLKINVFDDDDKMVGLAEGYISKWGSEIQAQSSMTNSYVGALLIVRHPNTGSVFTFVLNNDTVEVNMARQDSRKIPNLLQSKLGGSGDKPRFEIQQADYCINPNGNADYDRRFDVRVLKDARNSSGVVIVSPDSEGYKCQK